MGTVNSDHVKASSEGAFGTSNESCYNPLNIVFRELVRLSILLIERKGTWSDHCFRPATKVSGDSSTRMNPGRNACACTMRGRCGHIRGGPACRLLSVGPGGR